MFDVILSREQLQFAQDRAADLDARYADAEWTNAYTADRLLVGECGEIAFACWLRQWSIAFKRTVAGHQYDFDVGDYRVEIATTNAWHDDDQCINRRPDKVARNVGETDIYVGVARLRSPDEFRVFGWCDALQMAAAPLVQHRADLPPMKAVSDYNTTTSLVTILRKAA